MLDPFIDRSTEKQQTSRWVRGMRFLGCGLGLGIGATLVMTNPQQQDYTNFATVTASGFLTRDICQKSGADTSQLNAAIAEGCASLLKNGDKDIRFFIAHNTERQDFIIFSLYTTDLPIRPLRVLGILNQFFLLT